MKIKNYDTEKRFDYENGFYLTSEPFRLGNILSRYELYKRIIELPGDVIELGVFKGASFLQFCTFRELLENEKSRKIIGFDMFGEFPQAEEFESDKKFVDSWNRQFAEEFFTKEEIQSALDNKGFGNTELVKGNILETLGEYVKANPQMRVALLHIDTDVYEPAKFALEQLYDRIVPGGIIILDDYAVIEGETRAVDEFFKDKDICIKKYSFAHAKPSYIVKKQAEIPAVSAMERGIR